jgi:hypothetical protein
MKITPDVEKPLLFGHGAELEKTSFATMYDSSFGARLPAHVAEAAPAVLNQIRSTVQARVRKIIGGGFFFVRLMEN